VDEDGIKRTRTQYVFVEGTMSERERQEGGYTYLGRIYETNDTYFSLGGAQIKYNKNNPLELLGLQQIKTGDQAIISAIELWKGTGNFWQKYNDMIGTMGSTGTILGEFMDLSKGFRGIIGVFGWGPALYNARQDITSWSKGELQGIALADAAVNVVSVLGVPGAAISIGYTTAKTGAKGVMKLEQGLQAKTNELYQRYVGIYGGYGF